MFWQLHVTREAFLLNPPVTEIGNKPLNTDVALRSRHSFITALDARGITPPNVHAAYKNYRAYIQLSN